MSIYIGSWIAPAILTIGVLIYGLWPSKRPGQYGDIAGAFMFLVGLCICLAAWLVWSLFA